MKVSPRDNDHEFIIKEYYLYWYEAFGKSKVKPRELTLKVDNIISW